MVVLPDEKGRRAKDLAASGLHFGVEELLVKFEEEEYLLVDVRTEKRVTRVLPDN